MNMVTNWRNTGNTRMHLKQLLQEELKEVYSAEKQLILGMKKFAEEAISPQIQSTFLGYADDGALQIEKLKIVFSNMDLPAFGKKCKTMEGLLLEAEDRIANFAGNAMLDAALIALVQKIKHYEIAAYGTMHAYAQMMDMDNAAALFNEILCAEKSADQQLTALALNFANRK